MTIGLDLRSLIRSRLCVVIHPVYCARAVGVFVLGLMTIWAAAATAEPASTPPTPQPEVVRKLYLPYMKPVPKTAVPSIKSANQNPKKKLVDLGRRLFFERALSADRTRSCNDCHDLSKYGTNGAVAVEARKAGTLKRDVPSLYNMGSHLIFKWDGAHKDLRSQTASALKSSSENGMASDDAIVKRLESIPLYRERFKLTFAKDDDQDAGTITAAKVVEALVSFQQGLITRAPFDEFLLGDDKALSAEQLRGGMLFSRKNCAACHTGSASGGQMLQELGYVKPWPNQKDLGYYKISGNPAHKLVFRVPPLRNVEKTGPYFHDHSVRSLRWAIREITLHQQGLYLSLSEVRAIESFMKSFTGELPRDYIKPPGGDKKD